MSAGIAFLAGMGAGRLDRQDRDRELKRQDAEDARRDRAEGRLNEEYVFQKTERERTRKDQDMLRSAAAPVQVTPNAMKPVEMDNIDVGQPGEAPVPVNGYKVAGSAARFASQGLADTAAEAQRMRNVTRAADTIDPLGAPQRSMQAIQGQVAQLQLTAAQEAAVQKQWSAKHSAAIAAAIQGRPEALAQFMTDSKADGLDGSTKWTHRIEGDQLVLQPMDAKGQPIAGNSGFRIKNTPQDLMRHGMMIDQATPASEKLKDFRAEAETARKMKNEDADNVRADKALALQADGVKSQRAALGMQMQMFKLQQKAAEADARIPAAVKMQHSLYGKELDQIGSAMTKAMAEGQYDVKSDGAQQLLVRQRELIAKSSELLSPYLRTGAALGSATAGDPFGLFAADGQPATNKQSAAETKRLSTAAGRASAGVQPLSPKQIAIFDKMPDEQLLSYVKAGNDVAAEVMRRRNNVPVQIPAGMFQN
jgi:hypothetical protein